jgi:diacylglycerol kinase (ATP)
LVDQEVNALPRRSQTAYLSATLRALGRYRPVPCRIAVDGDPWYEGDVFLLAVANGRSFGKGMRIAPKAEVADGLADIVLVEEVPRWQLPLRLPQLYLGRHLNAAPVRCRRGRRVEIEPLGELPPFDVDGEEMVSGAAAIEIVPQALRFLA